MRIGNRFSASVSAMALLVAGAAQPVSSATCTWTGGVGLYSDPVRWSCGAQPGAGDAVVITAGGSVVNVSGIGANAGTINLGSGNALNVNGGGTLAVYNNAVTNNGTVTVASGSLVSGSGVVTVGGTGTVVLDDTNGTARLYGGGFSFDAGQTVRGSGQLGINQTIFSNSGLISANVATRSIDIDVSGGNGGVGAGNGFGTNGNAGLYNVATIQAASGGIVNFGGGLYENSANGIIQALAGSTINLGSDARILNGTLASVGTGVINAQGASQYLSSVTLASGSNLAVGGGDNLYLNTLFTNNGTVTVSTNSSLINEVGTLTFAGNGTIVLDNSAGVARIYGGAIVFGANQTIRGSGQLGINQTVITNNNLFSTDTVGGNIDIDVSGGNGGVGAGNGVGTNLASGLLNNATIRASNGSTLNFGGGLYENSANGIIQALAGSTINIGSDARILNGTLASVGTGVINAQGASQYLSSVTLASGSNLAVGGGDNLYLNTLFTNNGTVTVSTNSSLINEVGTLTFAGNGTIVLDNSAGVARIYGGAIVFGANQTIRGSGQLGINQTVITNNNLFSTDTVGGNIDIDVSGGNGGVGAGNGVGTNLASGLLNNATIRASNGSTLNFGGGLYENSANGIIQALAGSTINIGSDARILNGTLASVGTGVINAQGASQYLSSVTLASGSNLAVGGGDNLYLNTLFTNNGTVTVSTNSSLIAEVGTTNIAGNGTIVLDDSAVGTVARLYGAGFVFGSGVTIRGSGQLGINQTVLTNNGLITSDVNGRNISIDASGGNGGVGAGNGTGTNASAGMLNTAIIQATGGGRVSFEGGLYENTGTIRALAGSAVDLNNDSRIFGGTLSSTGSGVINAQGVSQYLGSVTLATGSNLAVGSGDNLYLNALFTNNGTVTLSNNASLLSETVVTTIGGNGTIVLDDGAGVARIYANSFVFGAGQTIRGAGQIGINQTIITNNGVISGDLAARNISIDAGGGSGGVGAGNGVGTNSAAGFYNTGTVQAANGGSVSFESGLYENSATGGFAALTGSSVTMNGDASLYNLKAAGVLDQGRYGSITTGAVSVLNLRSNAADTIVTIGTSAAGTDTIVTLSGAASALNVLAFGSGAPTAIDASLTTVARSGRLEILNGRNFAVVAGGGAFSNAGIVQLGGGNFGAASYGNSGETFGNGSVTVAIANTGLVRAAGGTLSTGTITGAAGTVQSDAGATLNLAGAAGNSTAGTLVNNGALVLGTRNITVTSDYRNANFGTGNAFDGRANVSGTGLILAASATQDLSAPGLVGTVLSVGNVRVGGSTTTALTITNNGTLTTLRGAVQNGSAPGVSLSNADFVVGANGGSAVVTIGFNGITAGSLAGQTLNVVNNFDNVADQSLSLNGNVYQIAVAGAQPAQLTLAARRVGDAAPSASLTIVNVAPNTAGFTEALSATASANNGFQTNGNGPVTTADLAPGASQAIAVSRSTATAGSFTGIVVIANTSIPVAGSGLAPLALASQSVTVNSDVYAPAIANLATHTVNFGPVRQGAANLTATVAVSNGATGALTDTLVTSIGSTPAGVSATAPGPLAAGATGTATFTLSTATKGVVSGNATLDFKSHDAVLADLSLASQTVSLNGTVTETAIAQIFKNAGAGALSGGGAAYTLDLGNFAAGAGSVTTDLGVTNAILASAFSETLGGAFSGGSGNGYSFVGAPFTGVTGGASDTGNLLTFNYTGLTAGVYTQLLSFNGFSRFPGLSDLALGPIQISLTAQVSGGVGGVPEPAIWLQMIFGLGAVGALVRQRRSVAKRRVTC